MELRIAACREVERLQLDASVRAASKLGEFDGTANWDHVHLDEQHGRMRIRSTNGAGTNTAEVWVDSEPRTADPMFLPGLLVYENHAHGRLLTVYKAGWWVVVVQALGDQYVRQSTVAAVVADDQANAKVVDRFTPLNPPAF